MSTIVRTTTQDPLRTTPSRWQKAQHPVEPLRESLRTGTTACSDADIGNLQRLHAEIGRSFFTELQPLIKQQLQSEVTNLRLERHSDVIMRALYPSCTITACGTVAQHHVAWYCPPTTTAYLLDAMLGGGRYLPPPLDRPLTEIERGLCARLAAVLWKQLEATWSALTAIQLETAHIDSEGPRLRIAAANEMVMVVTWTLSNPYMRTMMQVMYPWAEVQGLVQRLDPHRHDEIAIQHRPVEMHSSVSQSAISQPPSVDYVEIDWTTTSVTIDDLRDLDVGDVFVTDAPPDVLARVIINGRGQFLARVGQDQGKRSLQLIRHDHREE